MEHETNIHNRSKDLSAQTVEGKIAFGGERVKTNGIMKRQTEECCLYSGTVTVICS